MREYHVRICEQLRGKFPGLTRLVVHCKTEKQAQSVLRKITQRLQACKLTLHPVKTRIVNLRGKYEKKYRRVMIF